MNQGFPGSSVVKNANAEATRDASSIRKIGKIPWKKKWQRTPVILAWIIPLTKESGGLQSKGL